MKKKIVYLAVLLLIGYFFYTRVGESDNPVYVTYKVKMPLRAGTVGLTVIEKQRPGVTCRGVEPRQTGFITGFLEGCNGCRLTEAHCKDNLSAKELKIFDNRVVDMPYFSYEKGGLLSQQDFRILFTALTETEAKGVCYELRKYLRNNFLFFIGGPTECIRTSDHIG